MKAAAAGRDTLVGRFARGCGGVNGLKIGPHEWWGTRTGELTALSNKGRCCWQGGIAFRTSCCAIRQPAFRVCTPHWGGPFLGFGVPGGFSTIECQSLLAAWKKEESLDVPVLREGLATVSATSVFITFPIPIPIPIPFPFAPVTARASPTAAPTAPAFRHGLRGASVRQRRGSGRGFLLCDNHEFPP